MVLTIVIDWILIWDVILVSTKAVSFHNESHTFLRLGTNFLRLPKGILYKSAKFN